MISSKSDQLRYFQLKETTNVQGSDVGIPPNLGRLFPVMFGSFQNHPTIASATTATLG
jgi:hypothetical protein